MSKVDFKKLRESYSLAGFFENELSAKATKVSGGLRFNVCPNCGESSENSVKVSVRNQKWYCFSCMQKGDVIEAAAIAFDVSLSKAADMLSGNCVSENFVLPKKVQPLPEVKRDDAAIQAVIFLLRERKYIDNNVISYLEGRKIPYSIAVDAVMRGISIHLPSDPIDALRFLLDVVGKDLLVKSGMWKEGSKVPGIIYRPLAFAGVAGAGIEFRLIAASRVSKSKAIRYGEAEPCHWVGEPRFGVMMVEGPIDMLSAVALGSKRAIYAIPGAVNFDADSVWLQNIKRRNVLLAFDNDDAGRHGDSSMRTILAQHECSVKSFELQGSHDLNDFLVESHS